MEADLEKQEHDYRYYFDETYGDWVYNNSRDDEEDYLNQTIEITRRQKYRMDDLVNEGLKYKSLCEEKENKNLYFLAGGIALGWVLACWVLLV